MNIYRSDKIILTFLTLALCILFSLSLNAHSTNQLADPNNPFYIDDPNLLELEKRLVKSRLFAEESEGGFVGGGGGTEINYLGEFYLLDHFLIIDKILPLKRKRIKDRLLFSPPSESASPLKVPIFDISGNKTKTLTIKINNDFQNKKSSYYLSFTNSKPYIFAKMALKKYGIVTYLPLLGLNSITWHLTFDFY